MLRLSGVHSKKKRTGLMLVGAQISTNLLFFYSTKYNSFYPKLKYYLNDYMIWFKIYSIFRYNILLYVLKLFLHIQLLIYSRLKYLFLINKLFVSMIIKFVLHKQSQAIILNCHHRMKKIMNKYRDQRSQNQVHSDLRSRPQSQKIQDRYQAGLNRNKQIHKSDLSFLEEDASPHPIPRKNNQINSLHQQFRLLKDQIKYIPQKSIVIDIDKVRDKLIAKQNENEEVKSNENRQQLSQSVVSYQKTKTNHNNKEPNHHLYLFNKSGLHLKEKYLQEKSEIQKNDFSQDQSIQSKQIDSSSQKYQIYPNTISPLPFQNRLTFNQHSSTDSPILQRVNDFMIPHQSNKFPSKAVSQHSSIHSQLKHFSFFIDSNMQTIVERLQQVQKKYLSLDLYFEELKQHLAQRTMTESQSKQIWQAKDRQFKFLISEHESKIEHLKLQNEKLEKQLANIKIRQQNYRTKIKEYDSKFAQFQKVESNFDRFRKSKIETDKKFIEIEARAKILQKQKKSMDEEIQKLKKKERDRSMDSVNQRSSLHSNHLNSSHIQKTASLMREEMEYLRQRISALENENKQYEKQRKNKQYEIVELIKNCSENKMMLQKIKQINLELQNECNVLQKQKIQKELQTTENLCRINLNVKKKLKQYDNFKNIVIQSLDDIVKKIPKRIRKIYYGELINKNRTSKCQVLFKCLNQFVTSDEQHHKVLSTILQNSFNINSIEYDKIGLQSCFNKITKQITILHNRIEIYQNQNNEIIQQNKKIKQDIKQRQLSLQNMKIKLLQLQENDMTIKMRRQSIKNIPSNDVEISKPMSTINQQLIKKKVEVDKLNQEVLKLIEESHLKYLGYQQKIAEISLNFKHLSLKNIEIETDRQDLLQNITQKESLLKANEILLSEVKTEKQCLSLKISQLSNQNKNKIIQLQIKIRKLENQNEISKKSINKFKRDFQINDKDMNTKILMKDQTINDLMQQKKNLTIQLKISAQKLQFAKGLKQTKQHEQQAKNQNIMQDITSLTSQIQGMSNQLIQYQKKIKVLAKIIKEDNINLSDKDNKIQRLVSQLKRKQQQIQKNNRQNKEKQNRKNQIQQQYKKIIEQLKYNQQQNQKKHQQRNKDYKKLLRQLQQRQEDYQALTKQKKDDVIKLKDFDIKISQHRIQNDELLKMIKNKEQEIDQKDNLIQEQRAKFIQIQQKSKISQKQFQSKQSNQRNSIHLKSLLQIQNSTLKDQLKKKEDQIIGLIKQRQQLNFKLSEDLDTKSQYIKLTRSHFENKIQIMTEKYGIMEINLRKAEQELKKKEQVTLRQYQYLKRQQQIKNTANNLLQQQKQKIQQYQSEILNLKNRIQILQKNHLKSQNQNPSLQQQLDIIKITLNKYKRIIDEKQIYISSLQKQILQKDQEFKKIKNNMQKLKNSKKYQTQVKQLKRQLQEKKYKNQCLMQQLMEMNKQNKLALNNKQQQHRLILQQKEELNIRLIKKCKSNQNLVQIQQQQLNRLQLQFQILKTKTKDQIDIKIKKIHAIIQQKDISQKKLKNYIEILQKRQKQTIQENELGEKIIIMRKKYVNNLQIKIYEFQKQLQIRQAESQNFVSKHEKIQILQNYQNQEINCNILSQIDPNNLIQLDKSFDNKIYENEQSQDQNCPNKNILPEYDVEFNQIDNSLTKKSSMMLFDQFQNKQINSFQNRQNKAGNVQQVDIIHNDQTFQICEDKKKYLQAENLQQNSLIHSSYLLKLKKQLNQILNNKQQSFGPSFYILHSNSALQILDTIKFQLIQRKNSVNQAILQELAFIDIYQIDFCENIEPQLDKYFKHLRSLCQSKQNEINEESNIENYLSEIQRIRFECQNQTKKNALCLSQKDEQITRLTTNVDTFKKQINIIQTQIKQLIDEKQEEQEQNQKKFMKQSSIFKEEIMKQKSRADKYFSSYESIRKINDKILDILFTKQDLRDQLSDCFDHLYRVCSPKDQHINTICQGYLAIYAEQKDKLKKKKGWF